ncbi:hypothetical protein FRC02_007909 [Tulasnella sp. 418]|nr:hypothetical protein FRC02_007909 [Tulasnella sp. 418]
MSLSALPYELLVNHLLPSLSLSSLLALTCTSKDFATKCSDPILWKRKLETDFNYYPGDETARTSGFKLIYKEIHRPKVFVWGSYHALDDKGNIHVWGTLNGNVRVFESPQDDPWFAERGSTATSPTLLDPPTRFVSSSCGRTHSAALDFEHRVWIFTRWGRPNLLTFTGTLERPPRRHPKIEILQIDCGFDQLSRLSFTPLVHSKTIKPFILAFLLTHRITKIQHL